MTEPVIVAGASSPINTEARQTLQQFAEIAHSQLEREIERNGMKGQIACAIVMWHRVDPSVTYATHKWLSREFAQACARAASPLPRAEGGRMKRSVRAPRPAWIDRMQSSLEAAAAISLDAPPAARVPRSPVLGKPSRPFQRSDRSFRSAPGARVLR
jgi:hypothetical protein